ncbi:MAG: dienelactone hydrolase family protein [Pirellulaceae bacterium]|nr:dienelactone hydrolase family protein [Pirellulaceae bacterium]
MSRMRSLLMIVAVCCLTAPLGWTADPPPAKQLPSAGKQTEMKFKTSDGAEVSYLLYLPSDFDAQRSGLPLVLFLHGRGESNGPLSLVTMWGPPQMAARGDKLPYILVSPQCPKEDQWRSPTQQTRLGELLEAMVETYKADRQRLYLTGLSMGGSGSWRMAADHPERFAAVIPICGRGNVEDAVKMKNVPIWTWVGDQDGVYADNVAMHAALKAAGSQQARLTALEHVGHNSWSAAYGTPDLTNWMLAQKRSN